MKVNKPDNMDNIHAVIGHAVSCLIMSGKPVEVYGIIELLKQHEAQVINDPDNAYAGAIHMIMGKIK